MKKIFWMGLISAILMTMGVAALVSFAQRSKPELAPIIFGAPLPLGDPTGVEARDAAILAVEEINKEGGIRLPDGMHPVKLEIADSRCLEPGVPVSESLLATERLVLEKKVQFIIAGPERTEAWLACQEPVAYKHKVIMIASAGTYSPGIRGSIAKDPDGRYKYSWNIRNNSRQDVINVSPLFKKFKEEWGWKRFYVMVQDVAHTRAAGEAVAKVLGDMGWQQVGFERYPTGTNDFSLGLLDGKNKGANLIYISFEMPQVAILMRQWADLKVPALPMGLMTTAQDARFWEISGGAIEYAVANHAQAGDGPCKVLNPTTERYFKNFTQRWGYEPWSQCGTPAYASAWAMKDAIERAGSTHPDAVVAALYKTDLEAPFGRLRFDPKDHGPVITDDPKNGMVGLWCQWQKEGKTVMGRHVKRVAVWPPSAAVSEMKLPPWVK